MSIGHNLQTAIGVNGAKQVEQVAEKKISEFWLQTK